MQRCVKQREATCEFLSHRLGHTLQPNTWTFACFPEISVWVATSVAVAGEAARSAEVMVFCWADTVLGLFMSRLQTLLENSSNSILSAFAHCHTKCHSIPRLPTLLDMFLVTHTSQGLPLYRGEGKGGGRWGGASGSAHT